MGLKMTAEMNTKHDKEKVFTIPTHLLSEEFANWYTGLVDEINWNAHPHFYFHPDLDPNIALKDAKMEPKRIMDDFGDIGTHTNYFFSSNEETLERLQELVGASLTQYLKHMPPLTSADLMQSGEKISGLLTFDFNDWFVAIEVDNPQTIANNLTTLGKLTQKFKSSKTALLRVNVLDKWALVGDDGHHFLVSPFIGATLEHALKKPDVNLEFKRKVLATLKGFASFCETEEIFWRDLAPRNILIPNGSQDQLVLIDYEHLYQSTELDARRRHSLDINRRIWFGDVLKQDEIDYLFGNLQSTRDYLDRTSKPADSLEQIVYGKDEVSSKEAGDLLMQTALIERQHIYDNNRVFGHRIGRYLTDFVPVEDEAKLYFTFQNMDYATFCRYMFIVQVCINADSRRMLANSYNLPSTGLAITPVYLNEVQQNLNDNEKLNTIFDKYERSTR